MFYIICKPQVFFNLETSVTRELVRIVTISWNVILPERKNVI